MKEKIGVGIVTFNREDLLLKLLVSLPDMDAICVINDGKPLKKLVKENYIQNETNLGVGKSKNKALKYLLEQGMDHIFLIEDDIYIKDPSVFERYIKASKVSGIQHFNFSQHGMMNKTFDGNKTPNPRVIVNYMGEMDNDIAFYPHCVGAFSYYSRKCLEEVGLLDERYYNACEHVDHTYEIIKKGMHTPFWYFADIYNSWEYLGDEEWSLEKSTISSLPNHRAITSVADDVFVEKHGHLPVHTPLANGGEFGKSLKEIKQKYGYNSPNL